MDKLPTKEQIEKCPDDKKYADIPNRLCLKMIERGEKCVIHMLDIPSWCPLKDKEI